MMRSLPVMLLCLGALAAQAQQRSPETPVMSRHYVTVGGGYELGLPQHSTRDGMTSLHSVHVRGGLPLNFISRNLEAGIDMAYGMYAYKRYGIDYRLGNNHINTFIDYSSTVAQAGGYLNYHFMRQRRVSPYVGVRAGYAGMYSSFRIEDTRDPTACRALENRNILSDGTFISSYGSGVRLRIGKPSSTDLHFLDFSIFRTSGGEVNYVNARNIRHHHDGPVTPQNGNRPLVVQFVNPGTNEKHDHTVAEVHTSRFNLLQFRVSYVAHLRLK